MTELDEIKKEVNRIAIMHDDLLAKLTEASQNFQSVINSLCCNSRRIEKIDEFAKVIADNERSYLAISLADKFAWFCMHENKDHKKKAVEIANEISNIAEKLMLEGCPTDKNIRTAISAFAKCEAKIENARREMSSCWDAFKQMRMAVAGLNSAITTRLAGAGVERRTDLGNEGVYKVDEAYTDNGFLDTRKEIEKTPDAFERMKIALDAISEAPYALEGIRHKHNKLLDRMANSRDMKDMAEYKTAQTMSRKMAKMENIITERAGVFLDEFGKCARRTLNRTLGLIEQMSDSIKAAKLTKCAKSNLVGIGDVASKITTKYNEARGER